jgi:integrase
MANTAVSIRERIKTADGRWVWSPKIPIPASKLKPEEAQREASFYLVWTEREKKRELKVKGKTFGATVAAARAKQRHLEDAADGYSRPDPMKQKERKTIVDAIERQLQHIEICREADTLKAHRQALGQFKRWSEENYPTRRFVDEIDYEQIMGFRNWLIKEGNEKKNLKKSGNDRLTANWKAMRVNKFVKDTLGLPHGKGPIKKSDLGKMKPNGPPKIYPKPKLEAFFAACKPHENLRYSTLYEPAFREEELMYLEDDDVLVEKQMLRVQSKTRYDENGKLVYDYKAKANSEREVPISKELMQRLVEHMNQPLRPKSRLVFCTRTGKPDTHLWDKLQAISKKAELGKFDLKTFRATRATDWLRPKWLGGCGYDVPTVKNLLGHDQDGEAIWAYLKAIDNEVLVAQMNKDDQEVVERKRRLELSRQAAEGTSDGRLTVSGVPVGLPVLPIAS